MIDVCISLSGPHLDLLLPLCLESLQRVNNLSQIRLHFVDRGVPAKILDYILHWTKSVNVSVYSQPERFTRGFGRENLQMDSWAHDTAGVCQWMIDHCGAEQWVYLLHFDLVFKSDVLTEYQLLCGPDMAQIGEHSSGIVGYRRDALRMSGARLDNLDGLRLHKEGAINKLRHGADPRCSSEDLPITGLDVGEWLELHLRLTGWDVKTFTEEESQSRFIHSQCGSGYHGSITGEVTRRDAMNRLVEIGIHPIP